MRNRAIRSPIPWSAADRPRTGVVVVDTEHAQRPLASEVDLVALPPVERRAPVGRRVGGGAVRPLELEVHPSSVPGTGGQGRTARRA